MEYASYITEMSCLAAIGVPVPNPADIACPIAAVNFAQKTAAAKRAQVLYDQCTLALDLKAALCASCGWRLMSVGPSTPAGATVAGGTTLPRAAPTGGPRLSCSDDDGGGGGGGGGGYTGPTAESQTYGLGSFPTSSGGGGSLLLICTYSYTVYVNDNGEVGDVEVTGDCRVEYMA